MEFDNDLERLSLISSWQQWCHHDKRQKAIFFSLPLSYNDAVVASSSTAVMKHAAESVCQRLTFCCEWWEQEIDLNAFGKTDVAHLVQMRLYYLLYASVCSFESYRHVTEVNKEEKTKIRKHQTSNDCAVSCSADNRLTAGRRTNNLIYTSYAIHAITQALHTCHRLRRLSV